MDLAHTAGAVAREGSWRLMLMLHGMTEGWSESFGRGLGGVSAWTTGGEGRRLEEVDGTEVEVTAGLFDGKGEIF